MSDTTPVAVTSRSFSRHPVLTAELLERYRNVTFNDAGLTLEGDALVAFLRGHVKAITALERLDAAIFAALPELRVVSKYGVGLDMIDLEAMERHGVGLAWTAGVNRRSVAEMTLAFMIALVHRMPEGMQVVRDGQWRQIIGRQLSDRTVGIVGCGNVGKEVVRLLSPLRCRLLVHDIREYREFYVRHAIEATGLAELLGAADVVSIHLPLDDSTRGMFDERRINSMRRGACLVNTARGGIVDEHALKDALERGHLGGAALDVLADEPPGDMGLLGLPTVMATPHIGGSAEEAILAMGRAAIAGLDAASRPSEILAAISREPC